MTLPTRAYKVLTEPQMAELLSRGSFAGAPVDLADGYVHLSAEPQLAETVLKHFAGQDDLWIVTVDLTAVHDDLRWEPSRGGALFPHLYADLPMDAVIAHGPLVWESGGRIALPR